MEKKLFLEELAKKITCKRVVFLAFLLAIQLSNAQVTNYSFAAVSGTYTANASPTIVHSSVQDDVISSAINIGFNFVYDNQTYTQFKVSTNGWITFNTAITNSYNTNSLSGTTERPIIAPLWDDLETNNATTAGLTYCNYLLSGSAPYRVLTVEWSRQRWNYNSSNNVINIQCKLYETTNVIEFVYSQGANAVNSGSASIGITGVSSGFLSLSSSGTAPTASSTTETSNISTKPANGQIYRFTPSVPITITPSAPSICSGDSVSLTASSTAGYTYTWSPATGLSATTGATVTANPTTTTTYTVTGTLGSVTATKTVVVTVNPTPSTVDITNANASICPNAVQTLTATGGSITGATILVNSGTVNLAIPDNSSTGVSQTLAVSGIPAGATITKVDVKYNITHTFEGDVEVNLEAPNGKIVNLMADQGGLGADFTNTIATSNTSAAAFSTGTSPFTGTFKADLNPSSNLIATINTQTFSDLFTTPNGNWKVRVYDDASIDTGTLVNCSITITYDVSAAITWSPTTNLYTDAACTTAYTGSNLTTVYAKPTADVTYTATATVGSCTKTDTVAFTMKTPVSITSATAGASTLCSGDTTTLTANGVAGDNATVTWYSATGGTGTNYGSGTSLPNAAPGTYYAYVTGDCGTAEATVTVGTGATTTWTGSAWNNGTPTATMTAIIAAAYSESADITACSLTVTNNAVATIPTGYDVFLSKGLTVDSGSTFNLSSDSNLVQATGTTNLNSGSGTVNVYRKTVPLMRQDYVMWGSPVASQNLLAFSPLTVTTRFYTYDTTANNYVAVSSPSSTNFADATGYLIRVPNNHPTTATVWEGKFTGVPHSGNYTKTLVNVAAGQRFNAIANPYPSTITISDFVSANSSNITGTLYFWRKTNNTATTPGYCTWTELGFSGNGEPGATDIGGVLEVGQGFIVEATEGGNSVSFTNAMRVGNNGSHLLKTTAVDYNRIWLNMTSPANEFSQMLLGYVTGATNGVDMFDGKHFNDGTIALNMKIDNVPYVIQGKTLPFADTDVVPLNYKVTNAGNYTIAIDHVDGLFTGGAQDIFIKDNLNNTYTNLNNGSYTFATDAGTFDNRLELVYRSSALSNNNQVVKDIVVFKQNDQIVVEAGNIEINKVEVYDLRGRLVITKKDVNATGTKLQSVAQNQVLIVKVTATDNTTFVKKIMN